MSDPIAALHAGRYAAVLSDLDGTLVDSMRLHYRAYADAFGSYGFALAEADYMSRIGAPAAQAIPLFLDAAGVAEADRPDRAELHARKKEAFRRIVAGETLEPLPAVALLREARGKARLALVTSGNREGATLILKALGIAEWFEAVVCGEDVTRGKPDPEPFLKAAAMLGVAAGDCLVLEDTAAGIASGLAAGMDVVDVRDLHGATG